MLMCMMCCLAIRYKLTDEDLMKTALEILEEVDEISSYLHLNNIIIVM